MLSRLSPPLWRSRASRLSAALPSEPMSREHVVDVLVDLLACSAKHQKMSLLFASYSFKTILYQLLGAGESGRIESLYKLCALKEFLKLLNQNHKGSISIRANLSGDCPRANSYFSHKVFRNNVAPPPPLPSSSFRSSQLQRSSRCMLTRRCFRCKPCRRSV